MVKPVTESFLLSRLNHVAANLELRRQHRSEIGLKVYFAGQNFQVTSDRLQILDLLLSTYEHAYRQNIELAETRDSLRRLNENLEQSVQQQTANLRAEIAERHRVETELRQVTSELQRKNSELRESHACLEEAYRQLQDSQAQVIQQEKMASIGQLAAGIAHEINNPIGFVSCNLNTLQRYVQRLAEFCTWQGELLAAQGGEEVHDRIAEMRRQQKIDYILEDLAGLLGETRDGTDRVSHIVQSLKNFSRREGDGPVLADLNECLENTVTIAWNEIKQRATLVRDFGELSPLRCHPQQLNQVFLNLLVNAAQSISGRGEIRVKTWQEQETLCIAVTDSGCGIPAEKQERIFEPFFTTKPPGQGTGLGLSLAGEIVRKHGGTIRVVSEPGQGSTFTVRLPAGGLAATEGAAAPAS